MVLYWGSRLSLRLPYFTKFNNLNNFKIVTANMSDKVDVASSPVVAVCQMTSTNNKQENFEMCRKLVQTAAGRGAQMAFIPEAFDYIAENNEQTLKLAETSDGQVVAWYKGLAKRENIWLSLGGFHEKDLKLENKLIFNTHLLMDNKGEIVSSYRKAHLFDVSLQSGQKMHESNYISPGNEIVKPVDTPVGKVGLGICYDIRFPEMSLALRQMGAEILTYPSAFTVSTGLAHWEVLLRSRAIENQCYVVAAAQTGFHNVKRSSYGHAMIVDPWGCVVAQCHEGADIALAALDLNYLRKIRQDMPVFGHRRHDLYGHVRLNPNASYDVLNGDSYQFGHVQLKGSQIFHKTSLSMAFVNKKPVLPGHVLIAPLRVVKRLVDLTEPEITDVFLCVQQVQKVIEKQYSAASSTVAVQDGIDAGQTVPHVHIHILPRKPGDFQQNDQVYKELERHDNALHNPRTEEDMALEADNLRKAMPASLAS